jgi:transcription elongation GreA/GreB family factor
VIDTFLSTLLDEWQTDRRPLHIRALESRAAERQSALTAKRREAGRKGAARKAEIRAMKGRCSMTGGRYPRGRVHCGKVATCKNDRGEERCAYCRHLERKRA